MLPESQNIHSQNTLIMLIASTSILPFVTTRYNMYKQGVLEYQVQYSVLLEQGLSTLT